MQNPVRVVQHGAPATFIHWELDESWCLSQCLPLFLSTIILWEIIWINWNQMICLILCTRTLAVLLSNLFYFIYLYSQTLKWLSPHISNQSWFLFYPDIWNHEFLPQPTSDQIGNIISSTRKRSCVHMSIGKLTPRKHLQLSTTKVCMVIMHFPMFILLSYFLIRCPEPAVPSKSIYN